MSHPHVLGWDKTLVQPSYTEKFVLKGDWWVKGKEDLKSGGDFVCGPDGMYLGLSRRISTSDPNDSTLDSERRIIYGETHSEKYTLFDAWESGTLEEAGGYKWKSSWRSTILITGAHLHDPDTSHFSHAQISYDALRILLDIGRFRIGSLGTPESASVAWERGKTFKFKVSTGTDAWSISSDSTPIATVKPYSNAELTDFPHFRIRTGEPQPVRWFISKALALRTLLILCCGEPLHLSELTLADSALTKVRIFVPQTWSTEKPNYYYQLLPLFALHDNDKETVFNNYFNLDKEMQIVLGILAATIQQPNTFARTDFINLTQALEGFHRLTLPPGKYLADDVYEATVKKSLLEAIPSGTDSDFRGKLLAMLKHGHEYSQRKRFKDMARALKAEFGKVLFDNPTKFADMVCDTRNAFTHSGGANPSPLSEEDCHYANRGLQLFLLLLILRHLGAPINIFENIPVTRLYRIFSIKRFW